jgi:hypothetical protein
MEIKKRLTVVVIMASFVLASLSWASTASFGPVKHPAVARTGKPVTGTVSATAGSLHLQGHD